MFEKYVKYIGRHDLPNDFYPIAIDDIVAAERRLGFSFPSELREFFRQIGCGFYLKGELDKEVDSRLINRIIPPDEIADLVCDKNSTLRPDGGLRDGELPFFDVGDRVYLILLPKSDNPHRVLWLNGEIAAESVVDFFDRLFERAGFFLEPQHLGMVDLGP